MEKSVFILISNSVTFGFTPSQLFKAQLSCGRFQFFKMASNFVLLPQGNSETPSAGLKSSLSVAQSYCIMIMATTVPTMSDAWSG